MENREFMTPEEKAVDLVWSFYGKLEHTLNDEYSKNDWNLCVSCAQDVVNAIENFMYMDDINMMINHILPYFEKIEEYEICVELKNIIEVEPSIKAPLLSN
jgi:hypothetical protein